VNGALQLSLAVEPGNRPQQAVLGVGGGDETAEAIAYIDAMVPKFGGRHGTYREGQRRPIAYLYARQGAIDEAVERPAEWDELRFVEARGEAADGDVIEAEWLRLTGEKSTRRTETYGDTRARWKVAAHWRGTKDEHRMCWALDIRAQGTSPLAHDAIRRLHGDMGKAFDALDLRAERHFLGSTLLTTSVHPLVLVVDWAEWMREACCVAKALQRTSAAFAEDWTVAVEMLALGGHPQHEAIARATVEQASANPVIVRALQWVHEVSRA
jgi:hypothetical protein